MTDMVGQEIAHYRLDALIGDGGMGTVYKAYDLNLERTVAVKVMHAHYARQEEFRARLAQEARTAAGLDHPSIVRIFDFGQYPGGLYIAMEYVAGGSLRAHLQRLQARQRFLPLKQSLQIGVQMADALDYAHKQAVIHRDVKPSNIILKPLNRPDSPEQQPFRAILTDFGLVKLLEGDSMTQSGTTLGTPTYMSPEQCEGLMLDGRSDLYSLGVVLYELVTNRLPFQFKSLSEAMTTHMRGEMPPPASDVRPNLPPIIDSLLARALTKLPEERYRTGGDMAEALRGAMFSLEDAPTQVVSRVAGVGEAAIPSDILTGYRIRIETPGREPYFARLARGSLAIGRNAENDIVLPSEGVSRHHARLDAVETGWTVTDLGGINGTWLDKKRVLPNQTVEFKPGSILTVGPYKLIMEYSLEGVEPVATVVESPTPVHEPLTGKEALVAAAMASSTQPTEAPLAMFLARESLNVEPGRRAELRVEVINRGPVPDSVTVRVHGIPSNWIVLPPGFVQVPAGGNASIPILIQPPRQTQMPAGRQRFRIELRSQQNPEARIGENATLILGAYQAFEVGLTPQQIQMPGVARVTIRNTGNSVSEYSVIGRDEGNQIQFSGERGRISLKPGQTAAVEMQLEPRRRGWFGESEKIRYAVEVTSSSGSSHAVRGTATSAPLLPIGIIYAALFIIIFLCVLSALFLVFRRDRLLPAPRPTEVDQEAVAQTATAVTGSTATAAFSATSIAATQTAVGVVEGDRDGDGLGDAQEEIVGTDPDNPDTDTDGLLDGEEVLTWGTNPLNRDTDGDILLDGDEVRTYKTDPTNPDTDGDGIPDGVEVANGTNPLDPLDPPPTTTPTTTLPTSTATSAPTTNTPTSTFTPSPSETATATATPTPTSTQTPTHTPTITPTATLTPTQNATVAPIPAFGCSNTSPTLDGVFDIAEWGNQPLFAFAPDEDPTRRVEGFVTWVGDQLYLAYLISDPTNNPLTDSLKVYFDVNNNAGDPDISDRFFQISRDGTLTVRSGTGTNVDNLDWDSNYESGNWQAVVGEPAAEQWIVEMQIDTPNEMPELLNGLPFGMMNIVQYTGSQGIWPEGAISNDASTWQTIQNTICP